MLKINELDAFKKLNEVQKEAVLHDDGPLLVLAGAGTGKTGVLTTRLARILMENMALPGEILSVTFTNKAANEMKSRVGNLIGDMVTGLKWLGTFHSIGAQILRQYPEKVGLKNGFIILDTDDQLRLLKQIIKEENIDDKKWSAKGLLSLIDKWKNKGLSPNQISSDDGDYFANGKGKVLYKKYQEQLKFFNAADFGDLILECIRLFNENPDILEGFQNRFKYMLVDEYQDTNTSQYTLLKLLSGKWKNICCVGDDDQSIYSWRGAEVTNILKFEKDFINSRIIRLEQNYRSTGNILAAASKLIEANESRFGKTLWTSSNGGEKVSVTSTWDGEEEARIITDEIEQQSLNKKNLDEVAILVRASFQMREFEDRFVSIGLPYKVIGGPRFYERKEIRDANAYFRLAIQPNDSLALERVLNVPKRGIGETTLKKIKDYAKHNNISTIDAIKDLIKTSEIKPKTKISLGYFVELTERWNSLITERSHYDMAEIILEDSGYLEMLRNDDTITAAGRLDNIKELFRSIEPFESLNAYLEHISLVMEIDKNPEGNKVSLMTLHAAKGLEFDYVFLPGWEEGVFPNQRSLDEGGVKSLEEERRLAYVGITRAKIKSSIFYAANRKMHNQWLSSIPSRFVNELPEDNIEINLSHFSGNKGNFTDIKEDDIFDQSDYSTPGWERAKIQSLSNKRIQEEEINSVDTNSKFSTGTLVVHKKFGKGKIESVDGKKLTINFGNNGMRKVMENFVDIAT
ncbi:MAG: UvrD-helicase domain-containing protein [Hyphomicrobiales bacterium]|jgi:DNA helicase-2/ATP-dependent DNA helicase PcrA|nr:UvrD-helicase domain-containing protein [Alphaproteobacteria bacterium]MDG1151862.1 UvrD-helicase domain-containing protein [Hyphomicrobiales bacterium]MBT4911318.1 UvrD-helicase domain-containing protein [Alphaproteobacteria bacterium]MDG1524110.1 UvrD-helicase domain-containing protein [Hyphomicrobiales bacterium]MDG1665474.1 UvrD-helicase domain-containing protein [Hyphomicrobiales bacterium]|tara:strand:+ start:2069 stop:4303 length:2235 start_codon:yes stop_codon:yes gene_type:complete